MLQIKNTLGGGKPEGLYVWKKSEIGSELSEINKSVSTLPYAPHYGSAVVLNGEIHILGSGATGKTNHYKFDGTSWTSVSTLPYSFYQGSAVVLDGEIHIFGGYATGVGLNHYKFDGTSWTSVSTLPYNFYQGSAVILNGEIHILGSATVDNYTKHYKFDGLSWTSVSTLPYNFYQGSAVVLNGEIHILGSADNGTSHYKWNGSTWTSVSTLPYTFYYGSAVVFDNDIYILGSANSSYKTSYCKWNGNSWTSVSVLPYEFYYGCAIVFDNGIHILGSGNSSYRTAHSLIIGYVPVYTFLDYIVSDKETAYPDGGEKNGYWYEKVFDISAFGFTEYAIDTYIPTYDQEYTTIAGSTKGHKFSHSLGKEPKFAIVWCPSLMISNYYNTDKYYLASAEIGVRDPSSDDTGSKCFSIFSCTAQSSNTCKASYSTTALGYCLKSDYIWVQISNYFPYLKGGETYYIITFA